MKVKEDKLLFYLITALWIVFPLGQLCRLPFRLPGVNIYLQDLIIFLIFIEVARRKIFVSAIKTNKPSLTRPFLVFLLVAGLSWLFNLQRWGWQKSLLGGLYWLRLLFYFSVYLGVAWLKEKNRRYPSFVSRLIISAVLAVSLLGFVQYLFYPDLRPLTIYGWDPHLFRITGSFLDPGFTAMILLGGFLFWLAYFWNFWEKKKISFRVVLTGAIIYLALALTYSRSALLALGVTAFGLAWRKDSFKIFLFFVSLLGMTVILLPRRPGIGTKLERRDTVKARLENWRFGLKVGKQTPLMGVGFNNYRLMQRKKGKLGRNWLLHHAGGGADSSLVFVFATTGIMGLISYLYFLYSVFSLCTAGSSTFNLGGYLVSLALLVHSFFNNSLFYPWLLILWWTVLGLIREKNRVKQRGE